MEAAAALRAKVLVVDVPHSPAANDHPTIPDRFPHAPIVECRPGWRLDEHTVRDWLADVDVVYSAETFYDERFCDWARDQHVATVVHANPEFTTPDGSGWGIGRPSAWWTPTSWRLEHMPDGTVVVPFPVTSRRWNRTHVGDTRWVHVAGKAAAGDRNGTTTLIDAIPLLAEPCSIRIVTQEHRLPIDLHDVPDHVDVTAVTGGVDDHRTLYDDADALVLPRRYGGLCLPIQEAMTAGCAVAAPDIPPNTTTWPCLPVPTSATTTMHVPAGEIDVHHVDPADLAAAMDRLADPIERRWHQTTARQWALENSWDLLGPRWRDRMQHLAWRVGA